MNTGYISLGSNINRKKNIFRAASMLDEQFEECGFSSVYRTKPVGLKEQEDFFNAIIVVRTQKTFGEVKKMLREIENALGRKRGPIKSGPRTIDLDLLVWNKKQSDEDAGKEYNLHGLKDVFEQWGLPFALEKKVLAHKKIRPVPLNLGARKPV